MTRAQPADARIDGKRNLEQIRGDYQYRAMTSRNAVQRYWHTSKLKLADLLLQPKAGDRIIDIGCGSGVVADYLAREGVEVVGIDGNRNAIAFARDTFERPGLTFIDQLVDELELGRGEFSGAICLEVLEHLTPAQQTTLLETVTKGLRPGGRLLLTTPNYRGVWPLLEWLLDHSRLVAHLEDDQHISKLHATSLRRLVITSGLAPRRSGTYCTVAPFVAPLSETAADWAFRREVKANLPFGSLLYILAIKP